MIVYRVQDRHGRGPYNAPDAPKWVLRHNGDPRRPGPWSDKKLARYGNIKDDDFFGFASVNQLLKWFTKTELKLLHHAGFNVVRIDGEIVARSSHQVLFRHKEGAKKWQTVN